jgi:hypothetical protein
LQLFLLQLKKYVDKLAAFVHTFAAMKIYFVKKRVHLLEYPLFALQGLCTVLDGLIMFFSMGFLIPSFALTACKIRTEFNLKQLKKNLDTTTKKH